MVRGLPGACGWQGRALAAAAAAPNTDVEVARRLPRSALAADARFVRWAALLTVSHNKEDRCG